MNKGILSLLCLSLIMLMPACRKEQNEGTMKKEKMTRKKTETKTMRKKHNGKVVEETTTMKTESKQQPMK